MKIELCIFNTSELLSYNIDDSIRIELCSNYNEGGITPSYNSFLKLRKQLSNQIFVMIRPRGGDFCYSDTEFEMMKEEILWFKNNGADGIVLGILNPDGIVDKKRTSELVQLASPLPVTFHRAFDMSVDLRQALEVVIETGCKRILSSGGQSNVDIGFDKLIELKDQAAERIEIMPGGGVSIENVLNFIDNGFENIHLSSKKMMQSRMNYKANLSMTAHPGISSFDYIGLDFEKLKEFVAYVRSNKIH